MEDKVRFVKPKKKPLQIYLTEEQAKNLELAAFEAEMSKNQFILKKLNSIINKK